MKSLPSIQCKLESKCASGIETGGDRKNFPGRMISKAALGIRAIIVKLT